MEENFLQTKKKEEKSWNMPQIILQIDLNALCRSKNIEIIADDQIGLGIRRSISPAHVYSRFLPQDLLEDAFHPDSLSL